MNLEIIRERYLKDTIPRRLGALAANLARISSFSKGAENLKLIKSLLEESEYFIEWTAPEVPIDCQEKLVELQIQLAVCSYRLNRDENGLLKFSNEFQKWSEELLELSGLAA